MTAITGVSYHSSPVFDFDFHFLSVKILLAALLILICAPPDIVHAVL